MSDSGDRKPIDLQSIYERILNRTYRRTAIPGLIAAAKAAAAAAKNFLVRPNEQTLKDFSTQEKEWRAISGRTHISYAEEFKEALISGNYVCPRVVVNNPKNREWRIENGFVYGAISFDHPFLVKLGATRQHPLDRLENFRRRYALRDITPVFFFEISSPKEVELEIQSRLVGRRVTLSNHESREWFDIEPYIALCEVKKIMHDIGVEHWSDPYIHPKIHSLHKLPDFWPTGYIRIGGRAADSNRIG